MFERFITIDDDFAIFASIRDSDRPNLGHNGGVAIVDTLLVSGCFGCEG
jgi:hypothetical protein